MNLEQFSTPAELIDYVESLNARFGSSSEPVWKNVTNDPAFLNQQPFGDVIHNGVCYSSLTFQASESAPKVTLLIRKDLADRMKGQTHAW